jgi:hypothetical protein
MTDAVPRFKDFTVSEEPVTFRVAPDTFECVPEVSLEVLMEMAEVSQLQGDPKAQVAKLLAFFEGVMTAESYTTFIVRTRRDAEKPIGMRHLIPILQWMMEVYGLRPTEPSSESADGSIPSDSSSTATVSSEDLT